MELFQKFIDNGSDRRPLVSKLCTFTQGEAMTTLEDDKVVKTGVLIFTIGLVAFTVIILVSILITEISN